MSVTNLEQVNLGRVPVRFDLIVEKHISFYLVAFKAYCARVNVNGIQRTKEDYVKQQISTVFSSNTFEALLINIEQLRAKLLQLGCFREVSVVIDKSQGLRNPIQLIV